jgi:hypothetical protein
MAFKTVKFTNTNIWLIPFYICIRNDKETAWTCSILSVCWAGGQEISCFMKPDSSTPYYNIHWLNFVHKHSSQSTSRHLFTFICIVIFFSHAFFWQFDFEACFSISDWDIFMRKDNITTKNLIIVQQDATYSVYYISVDSSTCFGCSHPS